MWHSQKPKHYQKYVSYYKLAGLWDCELSVARSFEEETQRLT